MLNKEAKTIMNENINVNVQIDEDELEKIIRNKIIKKSKEMIDVQISEYLDEDNAKIKWIIEKYINKALEDVESETKKYVRDYLIKLIDENIGDGLRLFKKGVINISDYQQKLAQNTFFMQGVVCSYLFLENLMNGLNVNEEIEDKICEYAGYAVANGLKYSQDRISRIAKAIVKEQNVQKDEITV